MPPASTGAVIKTPFMVVLILCGWILSGWTGRSWTGLDWIGNNKPFQKLLKS